MSPMGHRRIYYCQQGQVTVYNDNTKDQTNILLTVHKPPKIRPVIDK